MNAWNVDEDSGSSGLSAIQPSKRDSTGASFQVKKHAFFAEDDDDSTSFQSREPPSSRRKQSLTGHKELVIDDDDDDLDERKRVERQPQLQQPGHRSEQGNLATRTVKASSSAGETEAQHHPSKSSLKSAKVDETGVPEVIHTVLRTRVSQSSGSSSATSSSTNTPSTSSSSSKKRVSLTDLSPVTTELLMHYLVHEFLKLHIADDGVVSLFEKEQVRLYATSSMRSWHLSLVFYSKSLTSACPHVPCLPCNSSRRTQHLTRTKRRSCLSTSLGREMRHHEARALARLSLLLRTKNRGRSSSSSSSRGTRPLTSGNASDPRPQLRLHGAQAAVAAAVASLRYCLSFLLCALSLMSTLSDVFDVCFPLGKA